MLRIALAVLLLFTVGAQAFPGLYALPRQRTFAKTQTHPDVAVEEVVHFLYKDVPADERCYWQFFHFLSSSDEDLPDDVGELIAYLNMTSTGPANVHLIPIDRKGRVWGFDFREANQNRKAWHEVVSLDQTCRQPHVNPILAEALRQGIGVDVDPHTFHCEGLIPAVWLVRQIKETDLQDPDGDTPENIVYYNLLYATERFGTKYYVKSYDREPQKPKERPWKGGVFPGDGKTYKPGEFTYIPQAEMTSYEVAHKKWVENKTLVKVGKDDKRDDGFVDRNFPRDLKDFQTKWLIKNTLDGLDAQKFFTKYGTIVAGYFNDPKNGSYVSFNDRVLEFLQTPLGYAMRTYDFRRTSLKRNAANFPLDAARARLLEDAGEFIIKMPNGWPAFLITNGVVKGNKRVESGDPHIIKDGVNGGLLIVQNMGRCVGCHYPSDVVLSPSNQKILDSLAKDNKLFTRNKGNYKDDAKIAQLEIDHFFKLDVSVDRAVVNWNKFLKGLREPYIDSLAAATATVKNPDGWTGTKLAQVGNSSRDRYDLTITLQQAAAELGYPRMLVVLACAQLGLYDAAVLLLDDERGVPRAEWDDELFAVIANWIALARDLEFGDYYLQFLYPEFVRDPNEKFTP